MSARENGETFAFFKSWPCQWSAQLPHTWLLQYTGNCILTQMQALNSCSAQAHVKTNQLHTSIKVVYVAPTANNQTNPRNHQLSGVHTLCVLMTTRPSIYVTDSWCPPSPVTTGLRPTVEAPLWMSMRIHKCPSIWRPRKQSNLACVTAVSHHQKVCALNENAQMPAKVLLLLSNHPGLQAGVLIHTTPKLVTECSYSKWQQHSKFCTARSQALSPDRTLVVSLYLGCRSSQEASCWTLGEISWPSCQLSAGSSGEAEARLHCMQTCALRQSSTSEMCEAPLQWVEVEKGWKKIKWCWA